MTTVAVTHSTTNGQKVAHRKTKLHSVAWLERELSEARKDLGLAGERLDATRIELSEVKDARDAQIQGLQELVVRRDDALTQKNDALTRALNERDDARSERDEYFRAITEARKDLRRVQEALTDLIKENRDNFNKARRKGDIAAVLASCLISATGEAPAETLLRFSDAAEQMDVSSDIIEDIGVALKRGYNAQVKQIIDATSAAMETSQPNIGDEFSEEFLENWSGY